MDEENSLLSAKYSNWVQLSINWDWDEGGYLIVWAKWNIELKNKLCNEANIDIRFSSSLIFIILSKMCKVK